MNENYPNSAKKPRISVVSETDLGVYAWQQPNGKILGSTDGDMLNVPGRRGDLLAIAEITRAAKYWGYPEGKPVFLEGQYRCTEGEYQEMIRERLEDESW